MKTTKNYTALSLALIFATVTSVFSATLGNQNGKKTLNTMIRHEVIVNLSIEKSLCNMYLVEIRNAQGQLIAPAKQYISGVSGYTFFERGPATGIRVATLKVNDWGEHYVCETELFTTPALVAGPFLSGETYHFDLFPKAERSKH